MKKILLLLTTILMLCTAHITTHAYGYEVGHAVYTDTVAYINHYPIPSYCFNGITLVAAEDLKSYGFNVVWNEYKNSLTISRNKYSNEIIPKITFLPPEHKLGQKSLTITTTDVQVFTQNYQYAAFGGLEGYTLINIEELTCIDGVSAMWYPETKSVKIWVNDGLEMRYNMWPMKRFDWNTEYYTTCNLYNGDVKYYYDCDSYRDSFYMCYGQLNQTDGMYCNCSYGTLEITDVIDADGNSRKKPYSSYVAKAWYDDDFDILPYFYDLTDLEFSKYLSFDADDLLPHTASEYGGLVKFKYSCTCGLDDVVGVIRVDCLPHKASPVI